MALLRRPLTALPLFRLWSVVHLKDFAGVSLMLIPLPILSYSNCPLKKEIEKIFQGDKALQEIMERNAFNRCYEKV